MRTKDIGRVIWERNSGYGKEKEERNQGNGR